jgi:pimeloyl-ACP methyl ester carboxylesterase
MLCGAFNYSILLFQMIHYKKAGKGPAVVLIHGFGADSTIWQHQVNYLQQHYFILAPDLRGSGSSANLTPATSIEQMADDVKEILDYEQISNCTLIGHSMGGYIILALAEKFSQYVNSIGLIHSTSYQDTEEKKQARVKSIEFIHQNSSKEFINATLPNLFGDTYKQSNPSELAVFIENGNQFTKEHLIAYYEAMMKRPDRTHILQQLKVPVLYFIGSDDKAVNPADALEQASLPEVCSVHFIQGIAHMGMLEAKEKLNKSLEEFLQLVQQTSANPALIN